MQCLKGDKATFSENNWCCSWEEPRHHSKYLIKSQEYLVLPLFFLFSFSPHWHSSKTYFAYFTGNLQISSNHFITSSLCPSVIMLPINFNSSSPFLVLPSLVYAQTAIITPSLHSAMLNMTNAVMSCSMYHSLGLLCSCSYNICKTLTWFDKLNGIPQIFWRISVVLNKFDKWSNPALQECPLQYYLQDCFKRIYQNLQKGETKDS